MGSSIGPSPGPVPEKNTYGKVEDRRPAARDGHSAVLHNGKFIVIKEPSEPDVKKRKLEPPIKKGGG